MSTDAPTLRAGQLIRKGLVILVAAFALIAALNNVRSYRQRLLQREHATEALMASLQNGEASSDTERDAAVRRHFYTLLEQLGNERGIDRSKTGVYVADPDFYEGAYTDKPADTILQRCAIQPFSIPAFTGMPLLSGLRARHSGCVYDSYGYQYLPQHETVSESELLQPCALARAQGLEHVIVIRRSDDRFLTTQLDCENR